MSDSKNKILYFDGIDDILICFMKTPDAPGQAPVYEEEIYRLPIATKLAVKGNGSTTEKWASSKVFRRVSRETKHELGLDHVGFPIALLDRMQGNKVTKGVSFNTNKPKEFPYFAFGFIGNMEDGKQMAVWYPRVQLSNEIDENYETTEEENSEIKDVTANLVATGLLYNNVINAKFDETRDGDDDVTIAQYIKSVVYEEAQLETLTARTLKGGDK